MTYSVSTVPSATLTITAAASTGGDGTTTTVTITKVILGPGGKVVCWLADDAAVSAYVISQLLTAAEGVPRPS